MIKFFSSSLLILAISSTALSADLKSYFTKVNQSRKGAFGLNMLQSAAGRVEVTQGEPPGALQFQAAFRNESAQALADQYSFYVGNLFTTNYYTLMGEYVYGNSLSSHQLDHNQLNAIGSKAFPKARLITQHWLLEKYYVSIFSNTALAGGFKLRGISGSEFELEYASYFFNFYFSNTMDETDFLAGYLLAKGSPLSDSSSLDRARNQIAAAYDNLKENLDSGDPRLRQLYQIRNIIHNQLSKAVIGQIQDYLRRNPDINDFDPRIAEVARILSDYYSLSIQKVVESARKSKIQNLISASESLQKNGAKPATFLAMTQALAQIRTNLVDNKQVANNQKTLVLTAMLTAAQYTNKELLNMPASNLKTKEIQLALIDLIYSEGFLLKDNYDYFQSEIKSAGDITSSLNLVADALAIANDTLGVSFQSSLNQWLSVEPKMQSFVDNTLKSSSLNTASVIYSKIK